MNDDLRYPVGRFELDPDWNAEKRTAAIETIGALPGTLRRAVAGLDEGQLDTPYRPEGWTVRQVVHHLPDSHVNAYVRFKLALTEETPTIKTYHEDRWAELPEARTMPIQPSLTILDGLHERWTEMMRAMSPEDFGCPLAHPELGRLDLDAMAQLYGWHCRHHVAHITSLRERMGWG